MRRAAALLAASFLLPLVAAQGSNSATVLAPWQGFAPPSQPLPPAPAHFVTAGVDAAGGALYPCRWNAGGGSYLAGTTRGLPTAGAPCSVPLVANRSAALALPSEPLLADARLGWFAGDALPFGVAPVLAGSYGGVPSFMCRGQPATLAAGGVGWVPGTTTMAAVSATAGVVCQSGFNGALYATFAASSPFAALGGVFQYLVAMPAGATASDFAAAGVAPAAAAPPSPSPTPAPPSPSATPSGTPSISASATASDSAAPQNAVAWFAWAPATEGLPAAQIVGVEGRNVIFVCRGGLANGDWLPGKYESVWQWCFVPINGTEVRVRWRRRSGGVGAP